MLRSNSYCAIAAILTVTLTACGDSKDTTAPIITLNGESYITVAHGATYSELGANVSDNVDTGLTARITGSVDTSTVGEYVLTYQATDSANNEAAAVTRTVSVVDQTAPLITLEGEAEITLTHASDYTELGATVSDNVDTGLTAIITGSVDSSTVGSYELSYNVSDAAGNAADTVTRTINITTKAGQFTGTIISGLSYSTASQSGTTDATGSFSYLTGESITFSVGEVTVGETVLAKESMTVQDLLPNTVIYTKYSEIRNIYDLDSKDAELKNFNRFNNILTFLYAIDDDANPDNGINIPTGIAELFAGLTVDFTQDVKVFSGSYSGRLGDGNKSLRRVTHQGAAQGLLANAILPAYGTAIEHFYLTQNIAHQFYVKVASSTDSNMDTIADYIISYTYDDFGNIIKETIDTDGNGSFDKITTRTYDNNQDQLTYANDSDGNGVAETIYSYTYDANGNKLSQNIDNGGDNVIDDIVLFSYDNFGNKVSTSYDNDANGSPESIDRYTHDNSNYILTSTDDTDANGSADKIVSFVYDTNHNRLSDTEDTNADGSINQITTYTYDANGNRLTESNDWEADDHFDRVYVRTYDANNNQTKETRDNDGDGIIDDTFTYPYDENGNRLGTLYDYGSDGIAVESYTYTYDDNGNNISYIRDSNGDGTPEKIKIYTYDNNGNKLSFSNDSNGDNTPESITTYTYDDNGNRLTEIEDTNADNTPDKKTTNTLAKSTIRAVINAID